MKIKNILAGMLLLLPMMVSSCSEDDTPVDNWESDSLIVKEKVLLSGSKAQTLNIKAAVKPVVTSDAEWLSIGEVNSLTSRIYSVELVAEPNKTGDPRSANITVTAGDESTTISVVQVKGDVVEVLSVDPQGDLDPKGGTLTVKYASTEAPVLNLPDWIKDETTRSIENGELKLTYSPNKSGKTRHGIIVLKAGKEAVAEIAVHQEAREIENISGKTAMEIAAAMSAGINIGNTMECPGKEGNWSMPVNERYVEALAMMGFDAVRIPCAWDSYVTDAASNTIDPAWLDRVDEVVGYVIGNGMFAILNIHWDGGWLENSCKEGYDEAVDKKQRDYWTQIANKLNHYDQHLLLAAMNEPNINEDGRNDEEKKKNKEKSIDAIMKYQQTMLNAVRATGGNNASRVLVMQAPNTSNEIAVEGYYKLPTDEIADRLMIETHFYGPYPFNMMEEDADWGKTVWYWGKDNHVEGSDRNATWGEEDWVKAQFDMMKKHYIDKGVPGITGEYCVCCNRENTPGIDKEKWRASARLWAKVVTRESKNAGMVPFFWEVGGDIDRSNGKVKNSLQLDGVFEGAAEGKYPF